MASVEARLKTFTLKKWTFKKGNCSALNMAKAGFISTTKTAVECYYCAKELDGWEETDDPWEEHKSHSGNCPFVMKYASAPDPDKFTILEATQLEKERLLLKVRRKFEESKNQIEKSFLGVMQQHR